VNVKYIENKIDRKNGLKIFELQYNLYGSRILFLILVISLFIFFLIEIIFQVNITNIKYFGLIGSLIFIWYLGIKYYIDKKKFMIKEEIIYEFDLLNQTLLVNKNIYFIKQYYYFGDYLLFRYTNGYLSVDTNKVDKKILKKYIKSIEKERTWKDTLLWSIVGLIIYFGITYLS